VILQIGEVSLRLATRQDNDVHTETLPTLPLPASDRLIATWWTEYHRD
jgi:hypothetical protein